MLTPELRQQVLDSFGISEAHLLGSGGESWVYTLDDERILRLYKGDQRHIWYVQALKDFYEGLPATFSFVCPVIYEIGQVHGWLYSIENRIPGQEMAVVLSGLARGQREQVFANYLHAVSELRGVTYPDRLYGELLKRLPLHASSWREFLHASIEASIAANQVRLASDVSNLGAVVATARTALATIPEPPKALVHGDYFPKNVMLAEDLRVSGIIDFSPMTVVGDPLMDVAGGLLFLEVLDTYQPTDSEILGTLIQQEYGEGVVDIIEAYRLYYSFYFAGAWRHSTRLYTWCVSNLKRAAATHDG